MSISSSNTEAKWCRHCNAEMVKLISKSERNLGRPYWKCFTTYVSIIFPNLGATRFSGYEWVTATNTPTEFDIQNQVDVKLHIRRVWKRTNIIKPSALLVNDKLQHFICLHLNFTIVFALNKIHYYLFDI
ncbi:unnamed protein product [Prunus armeniaca]